MVMGPKRPPQPLPAHVPIPDISTTSPKYWRYISEGGATIVFSYRGPQHDVFSHSVVRLRKAVRDVSYATTLKQLEASGMKLGDADGPGNSEVVEPEEGTIHRPLEMAEKVRLRAKGSNESIRSVGSTRSVHESRRMSISVQPPAGQDSDSDSGWQDDSDDEGLGEEEQPDDPTIEFQTRVTSQLVPLHYLPRLDSVKVGKKWIAELARISERSRPVARRRVDGIDLKRKKGVVADDLVGWEGWAVEIKPKWGFLPNPTHLSPETARYKLTKCRYCMHAYHASRAETHEERGITYCPLDLFSGDPGRVRKALGALWDAWDASGGSVNNLKIFVRGKILKPKAAKGFEPREFKELEEFLEPQGEGMKGAFIETLGRMLDSSPLLAKLSLLMRSLDALDIEGMSKLWREAKHFPMAGLTPPIASDEDEPSLDDWEEFVAEYLSHGPYVSSEPYPTDPLREEDLRYWLTSYLMSATFKDCSVMLRFPPGNVSPDWTFDNPERNVDRPLMTAIDLDPKSMRRLQKWFDMDHDIVKNYAQAVEEGRAKG
ncbi:Inositol-pentakisphosphate 2-kinase, partial [Ceratobasidium sp. 423]